jgi:hypothetical protein
MNNFRTELHTSFSSKRISLSDSILTIGSCFSDAIGTQLISNKVKTFVNPFGTIYNPHSIHKVIQYAQSNRIPDKNSFVQRQDLNFHYDFHSHFSSIEQPEFEKQLQSVISAAHTFLADADWLMITYGTAWVYELIETKEIVANCHKMPPSQFNKFLMTQKRILDSFESMYVDIKLLNPGIQIILTVSPVRHTKETLELNSVSKSILRVACHTLSQQYGDVEYFPAYEIMLDDLRDYRFYKSDMIHPSEVAEDYIWQKFAEQYFSDELKAFLPKWKAIRSALNHRPFHAESAAHQKFINETIQRLEELKDVVNVDDEITSLKNQVHSR